MPLRGESVFYRERLSVNDGPVDKPRADEVFWCSRPGFES